MTPIGDMTIDGRQWVIMHVVLFFSPVLYVFPEDYQAIASTCHKDEPYPLDTPAKGVM